MENILKIIKEITYELNLLEDKPKDIIVEAPESVLKKISENIKEELNVFKVENISSDINYAYFVKANLDVGIVHFVQSDRFAIYSKKINIDENGKATRIDPFKG